MAVVVCIQGLAAVKGKIAIRTLKSPLLRALGLEGFPWRILRF